MTLPVRILVRTRTDWRGMGAAEFAAQRDRTLPVQWIRYTSKRDVIDLWNEAFRMDFFTYRAEVRDIAASTLASAGADLLTVGFDELACGRGFDEWWEQPDDEIIVTVDDDDLFTPGLDRLPLEFEEDVNVVLWPQTSLGFAGVGTSPTFRWAPLPHVLQNNSAIRKSFLTRHFAREPAKHALAHHPVANEKIADVFVIDKENRGLRRFRVLDHPSVKFVSPCLGLYNQHVGSISFLVSTLGRDDPRGYLDALDFRIPRPVPEFATPVVLALDALEQLWLSLRDNAQAS